MKKIRVLVVEDSIVIRQLLEHIIGSDPRLELAGLVGSGEEALKVVNALSPDVISMDIRLPGMNGLEATHRIMAERPTPIVVVANSVESEDLKITVNALNAGALTVLEKPDGPTSANYQALAQRLCTQLVIMSQVKVVRRRGEPKRTSPPPPDWPQPSTRYGDYRMLGIVSSTGGPNALVHLLGALGADFPLPILLVQHIGGHFLEGFASWLQGICPFSVRIVTNREIPEHGSIYVASADHHLCLVAGYLETNTAPPVSLQRPSGSVLFESMAKNLGRKALGVLLTGMGDDGAKGLLKLRESGSYTIAEDATTAVVYGMPAEAVRLGAVCESLPLPLIGRRLRELTILAKATF
jgi:two-component system chemotaxis response regulator CheB